jgi:hypothetical protein
MLISKGGASMLQAASVTRGTSPQVRGQMRDYMTPQRTFDPACLKALLQQFAFKVLQKGIA